MSAYVIGGGLVTCADVYEYGGFIFEFHPYLGPSLCRKNGELCKRYPARSSRFWPVLERWQELTAKQRSATRWKGCR